MTDVYGKTRMGSAVRVLETDDEVEEAKAKACWGFEKSLEDSGLMVTPEAKKKWWGLS
jgi:hypothetical protein